MSPTQETQVPLEVVRPSIEPISQASPHFAKATSSARISTCWRCRTMVQWSIKHWEVPWLVAGFILVKGWWSYHAGNLEPFQTNWVDPKSQWFCACKNPKWTILDWVFGGFLVLHLLIDLNKWHGKSVAFLQSSLLNRWWELPLQWSNLAMGKSGNISWLSV